MMPKTTTNKSTLPERRHLASRPAGQEILISDPESGRVHFLNPTAALVWECCDGQTTPAECVQRLLGAFAIPPKTDVAGDIQTILGDLAERGLLAEATPNA